MRGEAGARDPEAGRGGLRSLRPLRHREFALLWSGGLVSDIGSWMQTVAVGALVTARTGEASWAVLVAAGAFLPIGVLSPVGGALADRLPRRAALVTGNVVEAALAAILAALVAAGRGAPAVLTFVVTVQGCVSALIGPFQQAILPDLVPREELLAAGSLSSAQWNLGRVVGPALAGATVALFGYPFAFAANAASFLAVVAALSFIRLAPPPGRGSGATIWSSIRSGARYGWAEPACRAAITTIAVVALLGAPFIALIPAVARHFSHGGARAVASATGALTVGQGVGAIVAALALSPIAARTGRGRVLVASLALLPPVLIFYAVAPTLAWAVVALGLVGGVYLAVMSSLSTVIQLQAPAAYRGRILSLSMVALGVAYPTGSLIQGPLADRIGLAWTTAGAAAVLAAIGAAVAVLHPPFLRALTNIARTPGHDPSAGATTGP